MTMFPVRSSSPKGSLGKGNANVKVVVRIRPMNEAENCEKFHTVTEAISDHMLVFDPKVQTASGFLPTNQRDINRRRFKDLKYAFDYVFGPAASNSDVFDQTTKGIVSGVLNGYNCSVFAYGATGAGKTHTMLGNEREPGVIYHTMIDLYGRINEQKDEKLFDVAVSYSEVYNEQVRDLLMPRGNLPIREDKTVGVIIAGLSLHKPKTAEELLHMLQFGNKNRTQHPTDANAESSRSHAVFQVFVNQREKSANVSTEVKMAKMCLVDLAGSERANHTTNRGARFREGANINRSLLALGNVINALADNKFKGHIPYRDSKLTRLLKDSLGGNCQTVMIAAVSPSSRSFEDTYNTLRYADRAKHIQADLKKNVMNVDFHIANYKKYVQELEMENQELRRAKVKLLESLGQVEQVVAPVVSPIIRQFQERLKDLFKARKEIRKAQMESEGAKRELKWKVTRKEQAIKRVQHLTGSPNIISKHNRVIERMKRRIDKEEQALQDLSRRMQNQDCAIFETYSEIGSTMSEGKQYSELLDLNVRIHSVESNLYDSHMYLAFVKKMARAQERQAAVNERLITSLIQLVKKQHDIIDSQDLLSGELKSKYEQCCYLVEERGVAWTQPAIPQDGEANRSPREEEEEALCISDIIDIQIPKLQAQTFTADKMKANSTTQAHKQPRRVVKATSHIVKPARTGVPTGQAQLSNIEDKNAKPSLSSISYHIDIPSEHRLTRSRVQETMPSTEESMLAAQDNGINAVEDLNASLDMCPKRRGSTPVRENLHAAKSSSLGLTFGTEPSEGSSQPNETGAPREKMIVKEDQTCGLGPCSSMPNIGCQTPGKGKVPLATNSDHLEEVRQPIRPELSVEDETSNTDQLNDTFQVLKPALPNTPCIDSSKRHLHNNETFTTQPTITTNSLSQPRNESFTNFSRYSNKERLLAPLKLDFMTDDTGGKSATRENKCETTTSKASPLPRQGTFSSAGAGILGGERENQRQSSLDPSKHCHSKSKSQIMHGTNRISSSSSINMNKQSPSLVCNRSFLVSNHLSSPQKFDLTGSKDTGSVVWDNHNLFGDSVKQVPGSVTCLNTNNINTLSLNNSSSGLKSYADVVKSPIVSKVERSSSICTSSTPVINNWVGEPVGGTMKTPDFRSDACLANVKSLQNNNLSKQTETPKSKVHKDDSEKRQPLRVLNTNLDHQRSSLFRSNSTGTLRSSSESTSSESTDSESNRTRFKVRPNIAKERRQNRAMSSNPYNVRQHKKNRFPSSFELLTDSSKQELNEVTSRPSYMQPTFARQQKMLGLGLERPNRREANNPLPRRAGTNRQPFTLSWSKTSASNLMEASWKL